jgi:integrase
MTLMRTGCRFGEACGLHWSDFDGSSLTIQRTANQGRVGTPKNSKTRTIDLSPQLLSELQSHRRKEIESSFRIGKKPKIIFNEDGTYFEYHRIRNAWIMSSRKKFGTNLDHPHLST